MLIYKIENMINGKVYIGQTIKSLNKRISCYKQHVKKKNKNNQYIIRAMRKYGFENFKFIVIDKTENQEQLDEKEIMWIKIYNSTVKGIGYNLEKGGNGSGKMADETRQKLSKTNKGKFAGEKNPFFGKKHSEETKKIMKEKRKLQVGENHPMFGKHFSEEFAKNQAGEKSSRAKLTNAQAQEIRELYKQGNITQYALAKQYKVCPMTINCVIKNKRYIK